MGWQGLSWRRFERLAIGAGVASLVFLFAFFGLPTGLPDFTAVYDARAEFVAAQSSIPFSGYLVAWAGNVVFTLLIGLGLSRRRLVPLLVGVGGELAIYSLQGAKSVLFLVVIAPTVVALVRRGRRWFGAWLLWGATVAVGVAAAVTAFTDNPWPLALTVVRPLALPAQLLAYYFDFFTTHEPYLLSHSILRPFVAPAYPVDPPFLIGGLYLHTYVDANANLWADAMANFGLLAIVPVSLILGAVLWILDVAARRADLAPLAPVLAIVALTLANGGLLTALLTNGIGLAIVVAALLPGVEEPTAPTFAVGRPDAAPTAIPPTRLDWPPPLPP